MKEFDNDIEEMKKAIDSHIHWLQKNRDTLVAFVFGYQKLSGDGTEFGGTTMCAVPEYLLAFQGVIQKIIEREGKESARKLLDLVFERASLYVERRPAAEGMHSMLDSLKQSFGEQLKQDTPKAHEEHEGCEGCGGDDDDDDGIVDIQ